MYIYVYIYIYIFPNEVKGDSSGVSLPEGVDLFEHAVPPRCCPNGCLPLPSWWGLG